MGKFKCLCDISYVGNLFDKKAKYTLKGIISADENNLIE